MSIKIQTQPLHALPPAPRHSITTHLPTWHNLLRFADKDPQLMSSFKSMYPRMIIHRDIKELTAKILELAKADGKICLFFLSPDVAEECKKFATSPLRAADVASPEDITIRIFDIDVRLYAVFFPMRNMPAVMPFWMHSGAGISSRLAEESLKHLDLLHEVTGNEPGPKVEESSAHDEVRQCIAELMERAPVSFREKKVSPEDVYLFQTGMSSIYQVQQYLVSKYNAKTVIFGLVFFSTTHVFENFGPGMNFLGLGNAEALDELETYVKDEAKEGRKIQAVWTEFPSNPLLTTPDLARLRQLADEYDFLVVVDDTIGSFCNVDVLDVADIVITSLTKSFSGYADVMGGSAVLNPSSSKYTELKALFTEKFQNHVHRGDTATLAHNSKDYLARSLTLNNNALQLVEYLESLTTDGKSSVCATYYPSTQPSLPLYQKYMRTKTSDFTPGYGCLFSVEFKTVEQTIAFYDALDVHNGPHLGAHLTLAIPFVKGIFGKNLEWASKFGMLETQVRISVGLEDFEALKEVFVTALKVADVATNK